MAEENKQLANQLHADELARDASVSSVNVSITSAASSLAYHVISMIATDQVFGTGVKVHLNLCESDDTKAQALLAVAMEAINLASGSVHRPPAVTSDPTQFFTGSDVILLLDDVTVFEREPRTDWLSRVYGRFSRYAQQIESTCRHDVCVIIPAINSAANLIGSILSCCAPNIPAENIIVTSRLVENRAKVAISSRCGVNSGSIVDLIVWGDAAGTSPDRFAVDVSHAKVYDCDTSAVWGPQYCRTVEDVVHDNAWLSHHLPATISSSSSSSSSSCVVSMAGALTSFLSDWWLGKSSSHHVHSVAVRSQGQLIIL